jgi:beta-galactosidase
LVDDAGSIVAESVTPLVLAAGAEQAVTQQLQVLAPQLWSPETPQLYDLQVEIADSAGMRLDALKLRVGIRTFALRGPEGLFLNGKPYPHKLLGGNRHQDHAFLGNALSNNLHVRDVQKLRSAGMRIIRSAHYPQDPAFMDACDQLGMFVIVATPGWQFFQDGIFAERVLLDVRQMVRRDRNRACLFGFEPVLNETHYPASLSEEAAAVVQAEYPHDDLAIACDSWASGAASFRLMYNVSEQAELNAIRHRKNHPYSPEYLEQVKRHYQSSSFLIREFGDNTNDWVAQDSTSRIAKEWGEAAQLVQLEHYDSAVRKVLALGKQDLGGCLWHPFDHQRGYHADPFWGGLLDAARQPKYSYWMFMAQRDPELALAGVATGPFVKILHETTAVSAAPIHVSSNCEQVHLVVYGKDCGTLSTQDAELPAYRKIVTFEGAYDFMDQKKLLRGKRPDEAIVVAEGLIGGQVVCQQVLQYANTRQKLVLEVDADLERFRANGSDLLPVMAYVCDERGNRKRLGSNLIEFEVEGQATLFGAGADPTLGINPQTTRWGEAIALVRSTTTPGEVTIRARELTDAPTTLEPATLTVRTRASGEQALYAVLPVEQIRVTTDTPSATSTELDALKLKLRATEKELLKLRQQETARGQEQHETGH